MTRNDIYDWMEQGILSADVVADAALQYLSSDECEDLARVNGWDDDFDEEDDWEDDEAEDDEDWGL